MNLASLHVLQGPSLRMSAACAVLLLSACSAITDLDPARNASAAIVQLPEQRLEGAGGIFSGEHLWGDRPLRFRREASTSDWFGVVSGAEVKLRWGWIDGSADVRCDGHDRTVKAMGLQIETPLEIRCYGPGWQMVVRPAPPPWGSQIRPIEGEIKMDGFGVWQVRSVHMTRQGAATQPLGYAIDEGARGIALIDTSHQVPRLRLAAVEPGLTPVLDSVGITLALMRLPPAK